HDPGPNSFAPHNVDSTTLGKLTQKARQAAASAVKPASFVLSSMIVKPTVDSHELSCQSCHTEHHGKQADLTRLSDRQCQSCHSLQFSSFSKGHPPFHNYPFKRRTRIIFDHLDHIETQFREEKFASKAPTACTDCHLPAKNG